MKPIFITFAALLVFFVALSFNVSAEEMSRVGLNKRVVGNQILIGGNND